MRVYEIENITGNRMFGSLGEYEIHQNIGVYKSLRYE